MKAGIRKIPSLPCIVFLCIFGFLTGVCLISLWEENIYFRENILDIDFIHEMNNVYVDKRALFFLCMEKRLRAFFILIVMSASMWNGVIVFSFFAFSGFAAGSIIELLVIRYGWEGVTLYFSAVFPHGILYLLGYLLIGCWCLNREKERIQNAVSDKKLGILFMAFLIILLGIYLESTFSVKIFSIIFDV